MTARARNQAYVFAATERRQNQGPDGGREHRNCGGMRISDHVSEMTNIAAAENQQRRNL